MATVTPTFILTGALHAHHVANRPDHHSPITPAYEQILTKEALDLVVKLTRAFEPRRQELLAERVRRAARLDAGERPDFLPDKIGRAHV